MKPLQEHGTFREDLPLAQIQAYDQHESAELRLEEWNQHILPNTTMLNKVFSSEVPIDGSISYEVAAARTLRLPVILMQLHIRWELKRTGHTLHPLLKLLPSEGECLQATSHLGWTHDEVRNHVHILRGETDNTRCRRFARKDTFKPLFILRYLLRRGSNLTSAHSLDACIQYCWRWYCNLDDQTESNAALSPEASAKSASKLMMAPHTFKHVIDLLAYHCRRLEPRLLVNLAGMVAAYIQKIRSCSRDSRKAYYRQCQTFNAALVVFRQMRDVGAPPSSLANPYHWEAQRILLEMSGGLKQPLLINHEGFRAIRGVLASLPKNAAEKHSSHLHSPTWPPYLRPADGMDEQMDVEESWSRTIRAGMMMQEAGFPKTETDEALDILQGLASDGTPTIQQRVATGSGKSRGAWASEIKATRNAHEAWTRFQQPLQSGKKPQIREYTAIIEKLCAREADMDFGTFPGDNALSFPHQAEANLAEFETARLRPPSVDAIYRMMMAQGIRPTHRCLGLLVRNAAHPDRARQYMVESGMPESWLSSLTSRHPDPVELRRISPYLFSAWVDVCARASPGNGRYLVHAIRLATLRVVPGMNPSWASFVWSPIIKNLGQKHINLRYSLDDQLELILHVLESIGTQHCFSVTLLHQFTRCIQKIARRELGPIIQTLESDQCGSSGNALACLYGVDVGALVWDKENLSRYQLLATRMKDGFRDLVRQEEESSKMVKPNEVSALDAMLSRRDPVKASHAHEYMVSLAYVGEFEEMAASMKWLIEQWDQPLLAQELENLGEHLPQEADMTRTICAFRAFAEPVLSPEATLSVCEVLETSQLGWSWPEDEMVEAYVHSLEGGEELSTLILWVGYRRRQQQREQQQTMVEDEGGMGEG